MDSKNDLSKLIKSMKLFHSIASLLLCTALMNAAASQATSNFDQPSRQERTTSFSETKTNIGLDKGKSTQKSIPAASGILSGIIGTILSGPIVGAFSGFGASFAADKFWGDLARAVGEISLLAHEKVKEIDRKYDVRGFLKTTAKSSLNMLQAQVKKHHLSQKAKVFVQYSVDSFFGFCKEHQVVERSMDTARKVLAWTTDQIEEEMNKQLG